MISLGRVDILIPSFLRKCSFEGKGFTLLEIIVTLVLIAITGALMFPVLRTNLAKSAIPVKRVDSQYRLVQEMDRMTGLYRREIYNETLNINTFKSSHVDTSPMVVVAETGFIGVGQITGNTYVSQSTSILKVTLSDGDQQMVTFFTE